MDEPPKPDDATAKPKPAPPSRLGKGPTPGSFKPGVSGNPKGRPKSPHACSEKIRERVEPDEYIDFQLAIARDESKPSEQRERAWNALIDRGFVKPTPTTLHVHADATQLAAEYAKVPLEVRIAALEQRRALLRSHAIDAIDTTAIEATEPEPAVP